MRNKNCNDSTKSMFLNIYLKKYTQKGQLATQFSSEEPRNETSGCSPQPYPPKRSLEHTHTHTLKAQPIHPTCPPLFLQDNKTSPSRKPHALSPCPHTHTHSHTPPPNDIKRRTRQILAHLIFNIS